MLSDLEMKGVLREAQASFNLCVNLRPDDNLFQECVRTFMTIGFPGGTFMHRLQASPHSKAASELVEAVLAMDDLLVFKRMMLTLKRELEEADLPQDARDRFASGSWPRAI